MSVELIKYFKIPHDDKFKDVEIHLDDSVKFTNGFGLKLLELEPEDAVMLAKHLLAAYQVEEEVKEDK